MFRNLQLLSFEFMGVNETWWRLRMWFEKKKEDVIVECDE